MSIRNLARKMPIQLTPGQLELQASRKAAKIARRRVNPNPDSSSGPGSSSTSNSNPIEEDQYRCLRREWVRVHELELTGTRKSKIVTWNVRLTLDFSLAFSQC